MVSLAYTQRTDTHVHQHGCKRLPRLIKAREKNVLVAIIMPRTLAIGSPTTGLVGLPIQPDRDRARQTLAEEPRGT